jgi:hypothetical protein
MSGLYPLLPRNRPAISGADPMYPYVTYRVLVACEFSGIVRDAFISQGLEAWSCDLVPSEREGPHIQGDVRDVLGAGWDLMVAFPPCTYLAYSGARWFAQRQAEQAEAIAFVRTLLAAPIPRIALENPDGVLHRHIRRADQVVQPYMFGHGEVKATCLWLSNLPRLQPTDRVAGRVPWVHRNAPGGPNKSKARSRTLAGFAAAMADQWGTCLAR